MAKLKVYKQNKVSNLECSISRNIRHYTSFDKDFFGNNENELLVSQIEVPDEMPFLKHDAENEADNAIGLFEYLNIDNTVASDSRLWVYLAHVPFCEYVARRWKIDDSNDVEKNEEKIRTRFFMSGSSRSLHRQAISKLWWAVRLTVAPWEMDASFECFRKEDKYYYTRILMSSDSFETDVMERPLVSSSRILLITILDFFGRNPDLLRDRDFYREFLKEVVLTLGYKKLLLLGFDDIFKEFDSIKEEVLRRQKTEDEK